MNFKVLGHYLDKEQLASILNINTHSMIIACAGSGKSLTLVGKIKYLTSIKKINPNHILCLTFTNEAALSLENKLKQENIIMPVYTFHKLALLIIKMANFQYKITPDDYLEYTIKEILLSIPKEKYFQKLFLTKNYQNSPLFLNYQKNIIRFLNLFQAKYSYNYFRDILNNSKKRDLKELTLIKKLYEMYLLEKKSANLIDFDDMIEIATNLIKNEIVKVSYKYIIVDEYQDTNDKREQLIKEIINKTKAKLTVVGDDFQSIYHFSGCTLNNFLNFPNLFSGKTYYLTTTYRSSQELINIATNFIMKNKNQIKKEIKALTHIHKPLIIFYYQNIKKDFLKALTYINSSNLLILSRNNKDIYEVIEPNYIHNNQVNYENYQASFKTIHKAKGLEAENVLIINLTTKINSLPSKIKDPPILKYVNSSTEHLEEERRLFYVALTRAKKYCYLFVDKKHPSPFIKELLKANYKDIQKINLSKKFQNYNKS